MSLQNQLASLVKSPSFGQHTGTSQGSCGGGLEPPSDIEMQNISVGACLQIQQFPVRKPWKNLKGKVNCQFFQTFQQLLWFQNALNKFKLPKSRPEEG